MTRNIALVQNLLFLNLKMTTSKMCLCLFLSVVVCVVLSESISLPAGGCLAKNTTIYKVQARSLNKKLPSRIIDIRNGDTASMKIFHNNGNCLPVKGSYLEFRLEPNVADANRIVREKSSHTFYFTRDHYTSFYKVY